MPDPPHLAPRLLVSVRSPAEARVALAGGCDLLDVKEPSRGSLGMAEPEVVAAVCAAVHGGEERGGDSVSYAPSPRLPASPSPPRFLPPISVALGELAEWPTDRPVPPLPGAVTFAKLGLSRCGREPGWVRRWRDLRSRFDAAAGRELGWIAVLYADSDAAGPDATALIDAAATTGCRGVLVDTFAKDGRRLFDHVSPERLTEWRSSAAAAGLAFAVAGSLGAADLPRLAGVRPDIVAVRGAACRDRDRAGEICPEAVRRLRAVLRETFPPRP